MKLSYFPYIHPRVLEEIPEVLIISRLPKIDMAFNKVAVGLLLLIFATSIANARVDLLNKVSDHVSCTGDSLLWCCQDCQCDESEGYCTCKDTTLDRCHPCCSDCECTPPRPSFCHCNDKLKSCPPKCWETPPPALKAPNSIQL